MILKKQNNILEYECIGTGPPIILIHSTASSLKQWKFLIDDLKNDFTLIAINLIGYGKSSKWNKDTPPHNPF